MTAAAECAREDLGGNTVHSWPERDQVHQRIGSLEAELMLERRTNKRLQEEIKKLRARLQELNEACLPY